MTNQTTTLVSRQAAGIAPSVPAQAMAGNGGPSLPDRIQIANVVSKAGNMVPRCYQGNPGAIVLLSYWAERHGKDLLSAAQGVYVTEQGQLLVSAEMRVELANDRGFDMVDVTEDAERRDRCTVRVTGPGLPAEGRSITVELADVPDSVKGPTKNGKPSAWMLSPEDMLLRMAQRRADKRFCRTAGVILDAGADDWDDPERADVLDVLASDPQSTPEAPEPAEDPTPEPAPETPAPAEPASEVDDLTAPPPEPITEEQLRRKAKVADLLRAAKDAGADVKLVSEIEADQALARKVMERVS